VSFIQGFDPIILAVGTVVLVLLGFVSPVFLWFKDIFHLLWIWFFGNYWKVENDSLRKLYMLTLFSGIKATGAAHIHFL
jgi:hypothetical protein